MLTECVDALADLEKFNQKYSAKIVSMFGSYRQFTGNPYLKLTPQQREMFTEFKDELYDLATKHQRVFIWSPTAQKYIDTIEKSINDCLSDIDKMRDIGRSRQNLVTFLLEGLKYVSTDVKYTANPILLKNLLREYHTGDILNDVKDALLENDHEEADAILADEGIYDLMRKAMDASQWLQETLRNDLGNLLNPDNIDAIISHFKLNAA